MGRVKLTWERIPPTWAARPAACLTDDGGNPLAAVFNPFLARTVAAVLDLLPDGRGRMDDARADLARALAVRLGVDEEQVREALEWACRRANVEVIPDEIEVRIKV